MLVNNTVSGAVDLPENQQRKRKKHKKGIFQRFWHGEELSKNMKIYSLGQEAFHMNYTGHRIIFQKWLSIAYEELFKGRKGWVTGESVPPLLQYNSQKLGTNLWT